MSAESNFRALLLAAAGVTELVGQKVALHAIPQDYQPPYIVFGSTSERQTLLDEADEDLTTFNVECWAVTPNAAIAIADAVQAAIEAYDETAPGGLSVTVLDRQGVFDPDLSLNGITLTVEWWP